jgi:hypothetical protein
MSQTPEKLLLEIARARLLNRPGAYEQFKFEWDLGGLRSLWSIENMFGPPAAALSGIFPPREIEAMHHAQMTASIDKWAARQPPPRPLKVEALPPLPGTVVVAAKVSGSLKSLKQPNQPRATAPAPVVTDSARTTPVVPFKKAALIAAHVHEWPSIERDIADANTNGLAATAKAGARGWIEDAALVWARANGKLISAAKPANLLAQAMHNLGALECRKHTIGD